MALIVNREMETLLPDNTRVEENMEERVATRDFSFLLANLLDTTDDDVFGNSGFGDSNTNPLIPIIVCETLGI